MLYVIFRTLTLIITIIDYVLIAYCILSWIAPMSRAFEVIGRMIEPFVRPFRPLGRLIMEKTGLPLDFSVMFLAFALAIANRLISTLYYRLLL